MLSIRAALVAGAGYRLAQGVTIATRYSCVRHQGFVNPDDANNRLAAENAVLDYQVQQYRIFKQLATVYAFVFTGKYILKKFNEVSGQFSGEGEASADDTRELAEMHATSAGLKAMCTFVAADGLEECRKCCGGHGVLKASGVAQMAQDYVTYCTAEGDRIILELQSAKFLIKTANQIKQGQSFSQLCNYLAPLKDENFDISNIQACSAQKSSDFRDLDLLMDLFRFRALANVAQVAQRLEEHVKTDGLTFTAAWTKCAVDLVNASRAHCYLVMLNSFVQEVRAVEDKNVAAALEKVCALFANITLQENLGDWLGHVSIKQAAMIRGAVRDLLAEVRPDAVALTDAFEFPDNVLNSALGKHDGNVYEALYASAKKSPLNNIDPFTGYKHLKKVLDVDFIREHAKLVRTGPISKL